MRRKMCLTRGPLVYLLFSICRSLLLFACVAGSSDVDLDHQLAVLKSVDGVTGVSDFGTEGDKARQFGVQYYVRATPEADRQKVRIPCSKVVGWSKINAVLEARRRIAAIFGAAALDVAEERVRIERAAAAAAAAAGPSAPPSAFERMAAAQHVAPAEKAAAAAEKLAAEARAELGALEQQLEAAARKVEEAEARAKQLEEAADERRALSCRKFCRLHSRDLAPQGRVVQLCLRRRKQATPPLSCALTLTIHGVSGASRESILLKHSS